MTQAAIIWYEPVTKKLQDGAEATGDGSILELGGRYATVAVQVSGSFSATVTCKASIDGTNYYTVKGIDLADGEGATTITEPGALIYPVVGAKYFKAEITTYVSGEVSVTGVATAIPVPVIPEPSSQ